MGSYNMAVNKILSVLLVAGSTPAWTNPQFNFNFNNNIGTERPISSTTPVPILRYVDTQNIDGSYTYGYEAADGTYKLETRYTDGRVKGKYGYIDPDGNLREASYGADAGRGFEPQIEGLELPPPVTAPEETFNEIPEQVPQKQFQNFQPTENTNNANKFKIVNGRRALVKKVRRVKATPAPKQFIDEPGTAPTTVVGSTTATTKTARCSWQTTTIQGLQQFSIQTGEFQISLTSSSSTI